MVGSMGPTHGAQHFAKVNRQGAEGWEDHWGLVREETGNKHHLTVRQISGRRSDISSAAPSSRGAEQGTGSVGA